MKKALSTEVLVRHCHQRLLFIYLDTTAGGASNLYNPNPTSGTIALPTSFGADYLIWISDSQTAKLLRWTGGSWVLDQTNYRFDTNSDAADRFGSALQLAWSDALIRAEIAGCGD